VESTNTLFSVEEAAEEKRGEDEDHEMEKALL
jgi:hypothetical protein